VGGPAALPIARAAHPNGVEHASFPLGTGPIAILAIGAAEQKLPGPDPVLIVRNRVGDGISLRTGSIDPAAPAAAGISVSDDALRRFISAKASANPSYGAP